MQYCIMSTNAIVLTPSCLLINQTKYLLIACTSLIESKQVGWRHPGTVDYLDDEEQSNAC